MQINSRPRLTKRLETLPVRLGWVERLDARYLEGGRFALACLERTDVGWSFMSPAHHSRSKQVKEPEFLKEGCSLAEINLEKALFWHGASACLRRLSVKGVTISKWYASFWGARSQEALIRALLTVSSDVQLGLLSAGQFSQELDWKFNHSGAVAAARVIVSAGVCGIRVYESLPSEDIKGRIDVLLVHGSGLAVALQIKSDRYHASGLHLVTGMGGDLERDMQNGIRALRAETATDWMPMLCTVGSDIALPKGIVGADPTLRRLFEEFLKQRTNGSPSLTK